MNESERNSPISSNQWIAARNRHVQTLRLLANDETVEVGTATAAFKWTVKYLEGLPQRWSAVETPGMQALLTVQQENKRLRAALAAIQVGTPDLMPPYRALGVTQLREIAFKALHGAPAQETTALPVCDCRVDHKGCERQPGRLCMQDHYHRPTQKAIADERCLFASCDKPALAAGDGTLGGVCEEHSAEISRLSSSENGSGEVSK